jgi:hypothetical protein
MIAYLSPSNYEQQFIPAPTLISVYLLIGGHGS